MYFMLEDKYAVPSWLPHLSADEYYASDRLGASRFKAFSDSPLHYLKFSQKEDTPAMRSGRMIHKAILEQDEFFDDYVIRPDGLGAKNTKAYKAWWSDQDQSKEPITEAEFQQCAEMYEAIMSSYVSKYLTTNGLAETSVIWNHECTNGYRIKCKGRLDYLVMQDSKVDLIVDYKTCASASESKVMRSMRDYKYYLQEQHYVSGYEKAWHGDRTARILFLFQEKTAPYDVCAVMVDDESFEDGRVIYRELMDGIAECELNKSYSGRNSDIKMWRLNPGYE